MDIKRIRTLNLTGTILFGVLGIIRPIYYLFFLSPIIGFTYGELFLLVFSTWIISVSIITYLLYRNTVQRLDLGDYETAKRWVFIGAVFGLAIGGGIITMIFFLQAHYSIKKIIKSRYYYPAPGYYPYPSPDQYGKYTSINCTKCKMSFKSHIYEREPRCPNCKEHYIRCTFCGRLYNFLNIKCPRCNRYDFIRLFEVILSLYLLLLSILTLLYAMIYRNILIGSLSLIFFIIALLIIMRHPFHFFDILFEK